MLVVFSPIFVADTKTIYGYNFVAPLKTALHKKKNAPNTNFSSCSKIGTLVIIFSCMGQICAKTFTN